jgi:methylated-DNA-[protein]-cysteine S-methyltransferase
MFSVPIDWGGYTQFQKAVLEATQAIPYGETRSYGEIAAAVGNPNAARAVGQAEKRNQVPLVIPCHRVIGSDGGMTGYGGTTNTQLKTDLIDFENSR